MFHSLLLAGILSLALAQNIVNDLSFGHTSPLSSNHFSIPGWQILGEGYVPEILSDKVIMTPPVGGNKRGALWSEKANFLPEWTVDFDFRAGGQDRGGGNMQLWYVKDGSKAVSAGSVYTTTKFQGLAIVVDTVGGVQKIRGFLNDGTVDYKNHKSIESLAFGHCDYSYRNLGRPSKLSLKYSLAGISVMIDGHQCFSTPTVSLPSEYHFGVTAASSDPPDSFEVFKLAVGSPTAPAIQGQDPGQQRSGQSNSGGGMADYALHKRPSSTSSNAEMGDIKNRVETVSKAMEGLFAEVNKARLVQEEILNLLKSSNVQGAIDSKLNNMDRLVSEIHSDVKSTNHKEEYNRLSAQIGQTHEALHGTLPDTLRDYVRNHTPRIGFIAFSFMAFQSCCLLFLLWQKYRKSTMPKKFL